MRGKEWETAEITGVLGNFTHESRQRTFESSRPTGENAGDTRDSAGITGDFDGFTGENAASPSSREPLTLDKAI